MCLETRITTGFFKRFQFRRFRRAVYSVNDVPFFRLILYSLERLKIQFSQFTKKGEIR